MDGSYTGEIFQLFIGKIGCIYRLSFNLNKTAEHKNPYKEKCSGSHEIFGFPKIIKLIEYRVQNEMETAWGKIPLDFWCFCVSFF
jgi:hypothetical protein